MEKSTFHGKNAIKFLFSLVKSQLRVEADDLLHPTVYTVSICLSNDGCLHCNFVHHKSFDLHFYRLDQVYMIQLKKHSISSSENEKETAAFVLTLQYLWFAFIGFIALPSMVPQLSKCLKFEAVWGVLN